MTQSGDKISNEVSFLYTLLLGSHGVAKQFANEQNELNITIDSKFATVEWNVMLRPTESNKTSAKTIVCKLKSIVTGWFDGN